MLCRRKGDSKTKSKMYLSLKKTTDKLKKSRVLRMHQDIPHYFKNFAHNCQVLEQWNNKWSEVSCSIAQNRHVDCSIGSNPCLRRKSHVQSQFWITNHINVCILGGAILNHTLDLKWLDPLKIVLSIRELHDLTE